MFNNALFKLPNRSKFKSSFTNNMTTNFGRLVPVKCIECVPGQTIDMSCQNLVRFMPLASPVLSNFTLDVYGFFVPYRVMDPDHVMMYPEKFFNPKRFSSNQTSPNPVTMSLPGIMGDAYVDAINKIGYKSTLFDYMEYQNPSVYFSEYREAVSSGKGSANITFTAPIYVNEDGSEGVTHPTCSLVTPTSEDNIGFLNNFKSTTGNLGSNPKLEGGVTIRSGYPLSESPARLVDYLIPNFRTFLAFKAYNVSFFAASEPDHKFDVFHAFQAWDAGVRNYVGPRFYLINASGEQKIANFSDTDAASAIAAVFTSYGYETEASKVSLESLASMAGYDNVTVAYDDYLGKAASVFATLDPNYFSVDNIPWQSMLDIMGYWRIVRDWFINSNIVNPSEFYGDHEQYDSTTAPAAGSFLEFANNLYGSIGDKPSYESLSKWLMPFMRYWPNDYFTSAFKDPQSGLAYKIPANGTMIDLRTAEKLQEISERSQYGGNRYIDQVLAFFGIHSRNTRYDMAIPLGHISTRVGVSEVTATSSTEDNVLGQMGGRAIGVNGSHLLHFTPEEHGIIYVLACVTPRNSYVGTCPRHLFKQDFTDYLIPELESVGDQPVYNYELGPFGKGIFGYQRRYSEYMFNTSSVHGEFLDTLDYWTCSRKLSSTPSLNEDFLQVSDADGFNRIFVNQSDPSPLLISFYFDTYTILPLSRYVTYDL